MIIPSYKKIALLTGTFGLVFMAGIAVNAIMRYGLVWDFKPEHNAQLGTFVASIAGTLFTLTSAILLYGTLQSQQEAIRNAQKEKAFNVCMRAIEEVREQITSFRHKNFKGYTALEYVTIDWEHMFDPQRFFGNHLSNRPIFNPKANPAENQLPHWDELYGLVNKLYWIRRATDIRAELDPEDRKMLNLIFNPIDATVRRRLSVYGGRVPEYIDVLLADPSKFANANVPAMLAMHKEFIEQVVYRTELPAWKRSALENLRKGVRSENPA